MSKQKKSSTPEASVLFVDTEALNQLSRTLSLPGHDILIALQVLSSASVFSVAILLRLCLDLSQTSVSWQANMKVNLLTQLMADSAGHKSKPVKKLESAFYTLYPELFLGVVHVG